MRRPLALLLLATALVAGCGDDDEGGSTATTTTGTEAGSASGCQEVERPKPKPDGELDRPSLKLDKGKRYRAVIATNCGDIEIALAGDDQPRTVASFISLAKRGFFDDVTFHRVATQPDGSDFVIQGGDPTGTGQGGPGYSVTERPPEDATYTKGVVAMAKTEIERPGTSGSQFFIVTAEDAGLPPDYAVLGRVVGGDDAVRRIAATPADPRTQQPTSPVVISKVTVRERS